MKYAGILKILTVTIVMSLLILAVPALPAMAVNTITLDPVQGAIGQTVTVTCDDSTYKSNYEVAEPYEYYAHIYFAEDDTSLNTNIDTNVKTYKLMQSYVPIDDTGYFETTFDVPSELDDYTGTAYDDDVRNGTYYVYVTISKYVIDTGVLTDYPIIRSKATFTVIGGGQLDPLDPASGPAGTTVTISGSDFAASSAITFKFDTTTITPTSGDTSTRSSGIFISTITIPASATAGTHTISVTVSSVTKTATFTVTASAALDPLSPTTGEAGTDVIVSGANFPASTALVFQFDTTTLTPISGHTSTTSGGLFLSTITIPSTATVGAHTITVTAGTGTATATFTVTATAALYPLSPASGSAGTDVTVSGANLLASYPIIFKLDDTTLTPKSGDTSTTTSSSFVSIVTIPAGTAAGEHTISVTVGTTTLTATFTVTGAPTPTPTQTPSQTAINVVQNDFNVGSPIGIGGAGFTPGANVTIKYAGEIIATAKVEVDTTFTVIFEIPALELGARQFTISDGVNTTTANFTIETTAPSVPAAISPESGTKLNLPITFDWQDVTDTSSPVTYDFQIATDEDFTTNSIVLEKKALAQSEFILTETEGLDLAGEAVPYYWRAKAVDAALNESAWTNASEFFTSGPSSFPKWAIYLIGVFGGLFLIIIGFWIGRRTAFYY
jgi:hypothetical protein